MANIPPHNQTILKSKKEKEKKGAYGQSDKTTELLIFIYLFKYILLSLFYLETILFQNKYGQDIISVYCVGLFFQAT